MSAPQKRARALADDRPLEVPPGLAKQLLERLIRGQEGQDAFDLFAKYLQLPPALITEPELLTLSLEKLTCSDLWVGAGAGGRDVEDLEFAGQSGNCVAFAAVYRGESPGHPGMLERYHDALMSRAYSDPRLK